MFPTFNQFKQWLEANPQLMAPPFSEGMWQSIQQSWIQERHWLRILSNSQREISPQETDASKILLKTVHQWTQQTWKKCNWVSFNWHLLQKKIQTKTETQKRNLRDLQELITKTFSPLQTLPNSFGGGERPIVMNKDNEITLISNGRRVYSSKSLTEIITKLEQLIS